MTSRVSKKSDRLLVRDGRRHYRRKFSAGESRIGFLLLLALASVLAWVAWKGAHPDPTLFMLDTDLAQASISRAADRGPLPARLASTGWSEGDVSEFDSDNLYVKINGREGYYKSFGFERLHFLSILSVADPQTAVDIELYDLGNASNAIGAYSGERSADVVSRADESGLMHFDRNALYMTCGRYYLRAIGSEESAEVRAQLEHLQSRFARELPGEPLPWGFALFVGRMGMETSSVSFKPENAYSFGFARDVYSATLEGETELFVMPANTSADAGTLANRFREGFSQYGTEQGELIKDQYLGTYATAAAVSKWVIGVYRASDPGAANAALASLRDAVRDFPAPSGDPLSAELADDNEKVSEPDEY